MSFYEIQGLRYHVMEVGTGETLVLLHGFTGSAETWHPFLRHFSARYRVLAIDLPGHGMTDSPTDIERYCLQHVAEDLADLLQRLEAIPAHWLGYSMGGRVALYVAMKKPHLVRRLIMESSSPGLATLAERHRRSEQDNDLADKIETHGVFSFVEEWSNLPLFQTQKKLPDVQQEALRRQRLNNTSTGLANSLRGMGSGAQPPLWADLIDMQLPILLMTGDLDSKFVTINQRMATRMPNAELRIIPDAGHAIHLEQPDAFIDMVIEFLEGPLEDRQHLAGAEQQNEEERRQGHLLEPRVERG